MTSSFSGSSEPTPPPPSSPKPDPPAPKPDPPAPAGPIRRGRVAVDRPGHRAAHGPDAGGRLRPGPPRHLLGVLAPGAAVRGRQPVPRRRPRPGSGGRPAGHRPRPRASGRYRRFLRPHGFDDELGRCSAWTGVPGVPSPCCAARAGPPSPTPRPAWWRACPRRWPRRPGSAPARPSRWASSGTTGRACSCSTGPARWSRPTSRPGRGWPSYRPAWSCPATSASRCRCGCWPRCSGPPAVRAGAATGRTKLFAEHERDPVHFEDVCPRRRRGFSSRGELVGCRRARRAVHFEDVVHVDAAT